MILRQSSCTFKYSCLSLSRTPPISILSHMSNLCLSPVYFPYMFIVIQLCISRTSFKSTFRLSRPSFSVCRYIFHLFYYCVSQTGTHDGKRNDAASLLIKDYFYPLAQQSCGGDIGSVHTYVRMITFCHTFVRMFTFCHRSSNLIYYPISIYLHTSIWYDNTSNKLAFQHDRIKVKVAVTIFRKTSALVPLFMDQFCCNFTQMLNMTISWTRLSLSILGPIVVVALLFHVHGKHLRSCRDGQLT